MANIDPTAITRRHGLWQLSALPLAAALPARLQDVPEAPHSERLFLNLFTRLATRVILGSRASLFVIDTGAQSTSISDRLAQELNLRPGPQVTIHAVTGTFQTPSAYLPRLRIEPVDYEEVRVPVFPQEALGAEGLLGMNHLREFRLTLDISRRRATLGPSVPQGIEVNTSNHATLLGQTQALKPVGTRVVGGLMMLDVTVGGVPAVGFLDTGSQYSIANHDLRRALGGSATGQTAILQGVSGPPLEVLTGPAATIGFGVRSARDVRLLYADLHIFEILDLLDRPALLIGADVMSRFQQVRIDYHRQQVSLGPTRILRR
jgi:predicted aspartyl protease